MKQYLSLIGLLLICANALGASDGSIRIQSGSSTTNTKSSSITIGTMTNLLAGTLTGSNLTANTIAFANASKQLISATNTGTGSVVLDTNPTIVAPTVANLANMNHTHQSSSGGGTLDAAAIAAGTLAKARGGLAADNSSAISVSGTNATLTGNLAANAATFTNAVTLTGGGAASALTVNASAYGSGWNGSTNVPTRDDVYDRVEAVAIAPLGVTFDGQGSVIVVGTKGYITCPYACTINSATIRGDGSTGSIVIDVWKKAWDAANPPTVADTITSSDKPTVSSAKGSQDTSLSWSSVTVNANDEIGFNVDSVSTFTRATLTLKVTK